jgi:hypothetical protein
MVGTRLSGTVGATNVWARTNLRDVSVVRTCACDVHVNNSLTHAALEGLNVDLKGTIDSRIGLLSRLTRLHLSGSGLTVPSLPTELFQMTDMEELLLSDLKISGTVPTLLSRLSRLKILTLFGNELTGTFPPLRPGPWTGCAVGGTIRLDPNANFSSVSRSPVGTNCFEGACPFNCTCGQDLPCTQTTAGPTTTTLNATTTTVVNETAPLSTDTDQESSAAQPAPATTGLQAGEIAAIVLALVVVGLLIGLALVWFVNRRRHRGDAAAPATPAAATVAVAGSRMLSDATYIDLAVVPRYDAAPRTSAIAVRPTVNEYNADLPRASAIAHVTNQTRSQLVGQS